MSEKKKASMARYLIPLFIFIILVAFFAIGLNRDPRLVPSPLVNKPVPEFSTVSLEQPDRVLDPQLFRQHKVSLFNVWASWCVSCRQEHPFLLEVAKSGRVPIYGLNYKDERADALNWLGALGNPYTASVYDHEGKVGIDWGVYGVPETFVVDGKGIIRHKHVGPVGPQVWQEELLPLIEQIENEAG